MKNEHTPTLWRVVKVPGESTIFIRGPQHPDDGSSLLIAELGLITDIKANAAIIVQAVNSHAALVAQVAAWKHAIEGLTPSGSEYVDDPERCAVYIRGRLAGPKMIRDLQAQVATLRDLAQAILDWDGGNAAILRVMAAAALNTAKGQP